jgi:hypothetical protein
MVRCKFWKLQFLHGLTCGDPAKLTDYVINGVFQRVGTRLSSAETCRGKSARWKFDVLANGISPLPEVFPPAPGRRRLEHGHNIYTAIDF